MSRHVLLIGGGHAHVTALRWLKENPCADISVVLVNPGNRAVYSGMVPGFVAGHFRRVDVEIDLQRLCREAGVELVDDTITKLDPDTKRAEGRSGQVYDFDIASIDVGIISAPPDISGGAADLIVKPMSNFVDAWETVSKRLPDGVAVVGGGLGGIELAFAVRHRMRTAGLPDSTSLSIIDRSQLLSAGAGSLRRALRKRLRQARVDIHEGTTILAHAAGQLELNSGTALPARIVLWTAGARPHDWLTSAGLQATNGFPDVSPTLQSLSHPDIFVAGDAAALSGQALPKAGVYAVRQGPVLMQNLIARACNLALREFHPQPDYLKLVSLGKRSAIAEKWGVTVQLPGLWGLKTHIDRAFVQD